MEITNGLCVSRPLTTRVWEPRSSGLPATPSAQGSPQGWQPQQVEVNSRARVPSGQGQIPG
jgi:hypothetical protein